MVNITDLTDVNPDDIITADRQNLINDYIQSGEHKINTLSVDVVGVEVIDSSRYIKPVRIVSSGAGGIVFYASDGITQIGVLDEEGNFGITGRFYTL